MPSIVLSELPVSCTLNDRDTTTSHFGRLLDRQCPPGRSSFAVFFHPSFQETALRPLRLSRSLKSNGVESVSGSFSTLITLTHRYSFPISTPPNRKQRVCIFAPRTPIPGRLDCPRGPFTCQPIPLITVLIEDALHLFRSHHHHRLAIIVASGQHPPVMPEMD